MVTPWQTQRLDEPAAIFSLCGYDSSEKGPELYHTCGPCILATLVPTFKKQSLIQDNAASGVVFSLRIQRNL
jgi:hypothetical protein